MFIPKSGDPDREDEKQFLQNALIRRFKGDQQLLYQDFPKFMQLPELQDLLARYHGMQDEVHAMFLAAGFGAAMPGIAINAHSESIEISNDPEEIAPLSELSAPNDAPEIEEVLGEEFEKNMPVDEQLLPLEDADPERDLPSDETPSLDGLDTPQIEAGEGDDLLLADASLPEVEAEDAIPTPLEQESVPALEEDPHPVDEIPETPSDQFKVDASTDDPTPEDDLSLSADLTEPAPMEEKKTVAPPVIPVKLNLPNGKTGVLYSQKIDISPLHRRPESLSEVVPSGFEAAGLTFSAAEGLKIEGTPDDQGKFPVQILLRFLADEDRPAQDYRLQGEIDILPDPRKLWKEIEPDASLPYPKPHTRNEALHMAGRTMIAASRRGRSHAHSGTFRDDEFELRVNEGQQWYIMAVADGAGSAPYSRRGSQIACDKAVAVLESKLDEKLTSDLEALAAAWCREQTEQLRGQIRNRIYEALSHAAYAGYKAITEEAEQLSEVAKAFHTTLMITIVRQFDFGYFVGTWWVGDGAVGILHRGKYFKLMGVPDGGQFAGQTRFLTMPEIWADGATVMKRIEFDVVQDFTGVLLMTDGVSDPKFHTDHNMLQLANWDALWDDMSDKVDFLQDNLQADEQLLEWLDFWAAGEHDDRSIAILY